MSMKEINQISIFEKLVAKEIKQKNAAEILNLSERQINRKLKKFREKGERSLVHGNRGKPSPRKIDPEKIKRVMDLLETEYYNCGPTFASELLLEREDINIDRETLRRYMIKSNISYKKRKERPHRSWRKRKDRFGHMIQLDASLHMWFENEKKYYVLLLFIDDATGKILYMELVDTESTENLMRTTYNYIKKYGRPLSIYTDRGSVFKVNVNNKENDKLTQYERALKTLGIALIHAKSPQAKGRVERSFGTHQNRLTKELRIRNISTIKEANDFINSYYINKHNRKFAKEAAKPGDLHRPVERHHNLDVIFSIQATRKLRNDWTIQYRKRLFQLGKQQTAYIRPGEEIIVHEHFNGSIGFSIRQILLNFEEIIERPKMSIKPAKKCQKPWIPPKDHPWRRSNSIFFDKTRHFHCAEK